MNKMREKTSSIYNDVNNINNESEEDVKIEKGNKWELIKDHKLALTFGTLGGILYGAAIPITGWILGKLINLFCSNDYDKIKKTGLKWCMVHLAIAIVIGLSAFLKIYYLEGLGALITSTMRKRVFKKYLELHVGFYDLSYNSPGALLTKLAIDTTQLGAIILSIFNAVLCTIGSIVTALIIGFIYDWKLTLIIFCFIPFLIFAQVLMTNYRENGREFNKHIRIEAGNILSECVSNSKTIFSFNFQNEAINMYKNVLNIETKSFLKDSLMLGLLLGLGSFLLYVCYAVVYKCSIKFIKDKNLTFYDMNFVMNTLMVSINGIADNMHGIGNYPKAKISFRSIYKIINTPSKINAFEDINKPKIFPDISKVKLNLKMSIFHIQINLILKY